MSERGAVLSWVPDGEQEMELRARYSVRARLCYNLGLLAFLGGFGLIMVPNRAWPGHGAKR